MSGDETSGGGRSDSVDLWVSYAGPDRAWAEWVATVLESDGFTVELDVWDWAVGENFVLRMNDALQRASRIVSLWSSAYFERERFTSPEWSSLIGEWRDRQGRTRLIPLRVSAVKPQPVLASVTYRDLFGKDETQARAELLAAVRGPSAHPRQAAFPGDPSSAGPSSSGPRVPGSLPTVWNLPARNPAFTGTWRSARRAP